MLDLVPFTRAWRKMANRNTQAGLICQLLQLEFPKAQSPTIASASVGGDLQPVCLRVEMPAFLLPPTPDRGDRKFAGVMVGTDIDETGVHGELQIYDVYSVI
ncbi:hypothetical protein IMCC3135_16775 [Granulosicoccus antarcticus IMCC3135]|uniref:Uncharacterized protein n=1 Tax=Granulosicoccus antarcticus IMCC3135 TaxID=1192854 RepID=A0A2Z2P010_9GAMM|nr:hypothetical protein IMCC3135_16775 [Granulosicoccus antarcticus IMCC3135]